MMNLKLKVDAEIKKARYPFYFDRKNCCVKCAATGSLTFVDIFGHETDREIYPFDHIVCKNCGAKYSIKWLQDEEKNQLYPVAVDPSVRQEVYNTINTLNIRQNGVRKLEEE
jgi:hypothetical protein